MFKFGVQDFTSLRGMQKGETENAEAYSFVKTSVLIAAMGEQERKRDERGFMGSAP